MGGNTNTSALSVFESVLLNAGGIVFEGTQRG